MPCPTEAPALRMRKPRLSGQGGPRPRPFRREDSGVRMSSPAREGTGAAVTAPPRTPPRERRRRRKLDHTRAQTTLGSSQPRSAGPREQPAARTHARGAGCPAVVRPPGPGRVRSRPRLAPEAPGGRPDVRLPPRPRSCWGRPASCLTRCDPASRGHASLRLLLEEAARCSPSEARGPSHGLRARPHGERTPRHAGGKKEPPALASPPGWAAGLTPARAPLQRPAGAEQQRDARGRNGSRDRAGGAGHPEMDVWGTDPQVCGQPGGDGRGTQRSLRGAAAAGWCPLGSRAEAGKVGPRTTIRTDSGRGPPARRGQDERLGPVRAPARRGHCAVSLG